jgi:hypothetical protein
MSQWIADVAAGRAVAVFHERVAAFVGFLVLTSYMTSAAHPSRFRVDDRRALRNAEPLSRQ